MAVLKDFKRHIEQGGAACRVDGYGSALVFRIRDDFTNSFFVGGLNEQPVECLSWQEVLDNLGDWASYGGWQTYRLQ
jgi:hypothetical protein